MKDEKIIYSILTEIKKDGREPMAVDYEISNKEFGKIARIIDNRGYLTNVTVAGTNEYPIVWMKDCLITEKGEEFLKEHNPWHKTYKGLKEIRDWLSALKP